LRAELGLTIAEGYHVHGPGVQGDGRLGLRVSVVEPGGAAVSVAWPATDRVAMGEESVEAYRGEVVLPVRVSGLAEGVEAVVLEMGYQACGRGACLPPCRVGVTLSTRPTVGDEA
jgi:DsbC/DsbD-like thiol-disulfide interchange protein